MIICALDVIRSELTRSPVSSGCLPSYWRNCGGEQASGKSASLVESGQVLGRIRADREFEPAKLRDLHFDVLIALTARTHGARLIT